MDFDLNLLNVCDFCFDSLEENNYFKCIVCNLGMHKKCLQKINKDDIFICSKCSIVNGKCKLCNFEKGLLFKYFGYIFHSNCLSYLIANKVDLKLYEFEKNYSYCNICKNYDDFLKIKCNNNSFDCHLFHIRCFYILKNCQKFDIIKLLEKNDNICLINKVENKKYYNKLLYNEYTKLNPNYLTENINKNNKNKINKREKIIFDLNNSNNDNKNLESDINLDNENNLKKMKIKDYFGLDNQLVENLKNNLIDDIQKLFN